MRIQSLIKIRNIILSFFLKKSFKKNEWKKIEYFEETWKNRLKIMAKYIPENISIIDLGCGPMWLKDIIKYKQYYPVDYKKRQEETIICDFNKKEFPDLKADYAFVAGCLEYVINFEWFIEQISKHVENCVISYCCIEQVSNVKERRTLAWVNDLSREMIISIFIKNGMKLIAEDKYLLHNSIFVFSKE